MFGTFYSLQGLEIQGDLPEKAICHEGVFYNYFSIGMLTSLVDWLYLLMHLWFLHGVRW